MEDIDPRLRDVFFDVQRGLPRQGPGSDDSTIRALELCVELPEARRCSTSAAARVSRRSPWRGPAPAGCSLWIPAEEYLDELRREMRRAGFDQRVDVERADMTKLGLPRGSFDLVWCEGAAYIMGVPAALQAWRPLLRAGGYLAFSELVWLEEDPDPAVADFFHRSTPR